MKRPVRCCAIAFAVITGGMITPVLAGERLHPYQMVRSLQLVQDRIAAGDHAAMPMQAKLLEMIDARFRKAASDDFEEPRNVRALLVFGMSGGNPATVAATVARARLAASEQSLAAGVVSYLNGQPAEAIKALEPIDPVSLPEELAAFVALVKGSLLAPERPVEALRLLDHARLLSPGTLVEEAALRRSVGIAVDIGDAPRFLLASTQYTARFLHSPYASQFADAFVSGVIALHLSINLDRIADITAMMDAEREKVIYLRIARRAAIDGLTELSAFASARAEQGRDGKDNRDDPRALLYASLSSMTSATIEELRATLKKIDRNQLSDADQALLDAAMQITDEITAMPKAPTTSIGPALPKSHAASIAAPAEEPASAAAADRADISDLPPVEGARSEELPNETPQMAETGEVPDAASDRLDANPASDDKALSAGAPSPEGTDEAIVQTRRKLDQIDQLLGASPL